MTRSPVSTDPCQCETPGWCKRHLADKPKNIWQLCQTREAYREMWDRQSCYNGCGQSVPLGNAVTRLTQILGTPHCEACERRRRWLNWLKIPRFMWRWILHLAPNLQHATIAETTGKQPSKDCRGCGRKAKPATPEALPEPTKPPTITLATSGPDRNAGDWAIGVTTSPIWHPRSGEQIGWRNSIGRTIESLFRAGWGRDEITIFAEPDSVLVDGIRTVERTERLGSWRNWFGSLHWLRQHHPDAKRYLIIQDDATLCVGVREYLEAQCPDDGLVSLYHNHGAGEPGWHVSAREWEWGALAYVLTPADADAILQDDQVHQHTGNKIDVRLCDWRTRAARPLHYHQPSMCEHDQSMRSSIGHKVGGEKMHAPTFPGPHHDISGRKPDVTLITPTGDRPEAFSLCERWMAAQDFGGRIQWIVVDDGRKPITPTRGQEYIRREPGDDDPPHTLCANIRAAIPHIKADKILFIEDDDYYAPQYVSTMCRWLDSHDLVGQRGAKYYQLSGPRKWHYTTRWFAKHVSLTKTGITRAVLPILAKAAKSDNYSLDHRIWEAGGTHTKRIHDTDDKPFHVAIKCVPGRRGVTWKREGMTPDRQWRQLHQWAGDPSAVEAYQRLAYGRVVVYTAMYGDYDRLPKPAAVDPSIRYVAVTDATHALPEPWEKVAVDLPTNDPVFASRYVKALSHVMFPDADWTIYHDANMSLRLTPLQLLSRHMMADGLLLATRHPFNVSDRQEATWCVEKGYTDADSAERLLAEGKAPDGFGCWQCGLLVRRHCDKVVAFNQRWWELIDRYQVHRDQISFPTAAYEAGINPTTIATTDRRLIVRWRKHARARRTVARVGT